MDPEELLPIGEFSRRSTLTIHQLRHYHEVGLLEPARVDSESRYRYYSPLQVQTAELIAILRSLDLPLAEIRLLLQDPSRSNVTRVLDHHRQRLEARFAEASARLQQLERLLTEGRLAMQLEVPRQVVEVRVDGVRVHVPSGQHAVILADDDSARHLTIWIGMFEATAIATRLEGTNLERPMTHDLLSACLRATSAAVSRVTIWRPADRADLFLAAVELSLPSGSELIDARPSDAIGVGLRMGAPIYVAAETLADAGVSPSEARSPAPSNPIPVRVLGEDGQEIARVEVAQSPGPGFRLHMQQEFEVLEVKPDEGGGYEVTARRLPESHQAAMYRAPLSPPPEAGSAR